MIHFLLPTIVCCQSTILHIFRHGIKPNVTLAVLTITASLMADSPATILVDERFDSIAGTPPGTDRSLHGLGDSAMSFGLMGNWTTYGSSGIFAASNFNVDGGLPGAPSHAGSMGGVWNNVALWNTDVYATRALTNPVNFSENREIYMSVRLRNQGDTMMGIGLVSGTDANASFVGTGFSWDTANSIGGSAGNASNAAYISHGTIGSASGPYGIRAHEAPGSVNGYGLLVARLTLSASGSDRIDIVRYAPLSTVDLDPTTVSWSAGSNFTSTMNATHLLLWINGKNGGELDAIRIGTTWNDVVQTAGASLPGILDLTQLANYANQPVPAYIIHDNTPPNNPITDTGATLGRVLFYDKRLSKTETINCASCHDQSHAFSDPGLASTGVAGTTGRHSMRLINSRFGLESKFFWDERAVSLEHQVTQPIRDHVEMGFSGTTGDPNFAVLTEKLSAIPEYRVLFAMTFGDATVTETRIQHSLAQFVRSIQSFDSKYDVGRKTTTDNQDFPNFTEQENQGKRQFMLPPSQGGADCASCHTPPTFAIDPASLNNGIIGKIGGGQDLTNTRAPTLRDLIGPNGTNGPFMHDGSITGLGQITNHYRGAIPNNTNLDPRLRRAALALNNGQLAPLRAFLQTLSGSAVYQDEKWSSPLTPSGKLELIVLPASALRLEHGDTEAPDTLNLRGLVAPNLSYRIEASTSLGNSDPWLTIATVQADAKGLVTYAAAITSARMFYRLVFDIPSP